MRFKRRTGKASKKFYRKSRKRIFKKRAYKTSNDFLTVSHCFMDRIECSNQRLDSPEWFGGKAYNYTGIVSRAVEGDPKLSTLFGQYEYARLVSAKLKMIPCMNPLRSASTIGYAALAVDPRAYNAWTPATQDMKELVQSHKFCKMRAYPVPLSMKVRSIAKVCNETDMAIWQPTENTNSLYTDYKSGIQPPVYKLLVEITDQTYQATTFAGYLRVEYKIQFKNLKRFN